MAYGIIANQTPQVDAFTKDQTLQSTTAALYELSGETALPDNAFQKIKTLIDSANANTNTKAKVQLVYYQGTDTFGESGATSITFSFAPKAVICLGKVYRGALFTVDNNYTITVPMELLSTSYTSGWGFGYQTMGKKSPDGKTLTWYSSATAQGQFNQSDYRYYYLGIG